MTFGEKLQKLRREHGLSQEQLAGEVDVSRQAVSKWEMGTAAPNVESVVRLSEYFGVSTDYLLKDELTGEAPASAPWWKGWKWTARRVGGCTMGVSAFGLLLLLVLAYIVHPVVLFIAGVKRPLTGLPAYLESRELWGVWEFCWIGFAVGLAIFWYPKWGGLFGDEPEGKS